MCDKLYRSRSEHGMKLEIDASQIQLDKVQENDVSLSVQRVIWRGRLQGGVYEMFIVVV